MLAVISAFTRGEDLQTPGATSFLASLELGQICMRVSWCVLGAVHQKARETCLCVSICWKSPNSSKLAEICQVVPFSLIAGHWQVRVLLITILITNTRF